MYLIACSLMFWLSFGYSSVHIEGVKTKKYHENLIKYQECSKYLECLVLFAGVCICYRTLGIKII